MTHMDAQELFKHLDSLTEAVRMLGVAKIQENKIPVLRNLARDSKADRGLLYVDKHNALGFSLCGNVGEEANERIRIKRNGGEIRGIYNKGVE